MRLMIDLQPEEEQALLELAQRERRHPSDQAAIAVRRELERLGMLAIERRVQEVERQAVEHAH